MTGPRNAQMEPKLPAAVPQFFDEDLVKRAFPVRFRNIGNPNQYLNEIGIIPILEFIYKGHLLIDVAQATNVPLTTLRLWIEHEGHYEAVSEAETQSAEGFLADAMRRLKTAPTEFELRRANAMMKHAQYMATKKNKPLYGETQNTPTGNVVKYEFNIGAQTPPQQARDIIEGVLSRPPLPPASDKQDSTPVVFDLAAVYGLPFGVAPGNVPARIEPLLVAARPLRPTPKEPDVGPFFDDPTDQPLTELPARDT